MDVRVKLTEKQPKREDSRTFSLSFQILSGEREREREEKMERNKSSTYGNQKASGGGETNITFDRKPNKPQVYREEKTNKESKRATQK